jgi:RimJ/RimL family protein N-acetyltransferase
MRISTRFQFRPLSEEEVEGGYWEWFNDMETTKGMVHGAIPMTKEECLEYVGQVRKSNSAIVFAVYTRVNPIKHVANVSLQRICWHHRSAEFGIIIGDAQSRGRGYGTEITKYIVDYGFRELNLHRIHLGVLSSNKAGINAYKKAGFIVCGIDREAVYKDGQWVDVVRMEVINGRQ